MIDGIFFLTKSIICIEYVQIFENIQTGVKLENDIYKII